MQTITSLVSNPYVVAGVVGVAAYYGVEQYKPDILKDIAYATPENVGVAAAIAVLALMYYQGKLKLPFGSLSGSSGLGAGTSTGTLGSRMTQSAMASSISDLLGPDQF